jgi:DNA-binding NarL/FixJ family response regulator
LKLVLVEPECEGPGPLDDLLARHPDLQVVARVASARDVPQALRELPDDRGVTALVSLELSGEQDALWLIRKIRQNYPGCRILAFGTTVGQIMIENAFFAGADGYLDTTADPARLAEAVRQDSREVVLVEGLDDRTAASQSPPRRPSSTAQPEPSPRAEPRPPRPEPVPPRGPGGAGIGSAAHPPP